jgi:hypothetical protein
MPSKTSKKQNWMVATLAVLIASLAMALATASPAGATAVTPLPSCPVDPDTLLCYVAKVSIGLEPNSIMTGDQTTLKWSSSNCQSVTINGGDYGLSGSMLLGPFNKAGSFDWRIDCVGAGTGNNPTMTTTLKVTDPAPPTTSSTTTTTTTTTPPPPSNKTPVGYFDVINSGGIAGGWTCDADGFAQALSVHFYLDGPSGGGGRFIGATTANVGREVGVAGQCGGNANHGFAFALPDSLKDGKTHTLYAYAINIPSGYNPPLSGSPKTFNLPAPPVATWVKLVADPADVVAGTSTTLTWSSNAGSCSAAWTSSTAPSGSQSVTPPLTSTTTAYAITCAGVTFSVPVTIHIDPAALPPNTVAEGEADASSTLGFGASGCKHTWARNNYHNRLTGKVYFRYKLEQDFCFNGTQVTSVYNQHAFSEEAHYPWSFDGNVTGPTTGGVKTYTATTFAQGKFTACVLVYHLGCVLSVSPYVRLVVYGNGTMSYGVGIG